MASHVGTRELSVSISILFSAPATSSRVICIGWSSHLDYYHSLPYGILDILLWHLEAVQNAAARLVTDTQKCDHITPVLQQLHWLPVQQRVEFNLAVLVCKVLDNLAPPWLSDNWHLVATTGHRQLWSSDNFKCTVINTSSHFGDQAFGTARPCPWNSLPTCLLA